MSSGCYKRLRDAVDFSTGSNSSDFVTFQWCKFRWPFAIYRFVVAAYFFTLMILCAVWAKKYIIFLTYWTLTVFAGYLILSAVLCIVLSDNPALFSNALVRGLLSICWFLYNIVATLNPIIAIIYWMLVYKPTTQTPLIHNLTIHFFNGVFVVFNLVVSAQPHKWSHVWVPMLYASLYFIFMGVWYKAGGLNEHEKPYVYAAIDFSTDPLKSALLIVGLIFIAIPVVHTIIWVLTKLRLFIYEKCCCRGTRVTTLSSELPQMVQRMSISSTHDNNLESSEHVVTIPMSP
uniref:Protein rolling stone n=1 Tax=Plectus sambesii TaxID=2011161 RepID=A0A914X026_9BILA